uniref:Testis-expressed protein 101 n=1 Tax=Cricetulus griseus TaxID=10029 RepID=TX101_CRIGR|nr:testis-expressed protein 101 precursor [Cricetulus griseus]Q7TQN2.1 RecName: Full=Testis-expressed protein 101; AltName: Full=Lipid raft-associated glycoprotein TEC-21; Flags: Precursor [Cricetulus griseus]AAP73441.1 lipid raft-associated glycoprotein TEC-21 [Cricetulus griseus]
MAACWVHYLLLLLLGVSHQTLAQSLQCAVSKVLRLEDDPSRTFNWTSKPDKVETCNPGELCQETVLLIKAEGTKTAVVASKGCASREIEAVTFIQYTPPPGVIAISYSNYCNSSLCNNSKNVSLFWKPPDTTATSKILGALSCPTCVALGSCSSAPSMPCANSTTQCYQGKIELSGGGMDSVLHIKGCTTAIGCRLMAAITSVGPMTVKETCSYHSLLQPRKAEESRASGRSTSLWVLELLLPAVLVALTHFP